MITCFERPYKICFSKNPIRYGLLTDSDTTQSGFTIETRIMYRPFGSADNFNELIAIPLTPDTGKSAFLDIRSIIDSLIVYNKPDLRTISIQQATGQGVEFYIDYREITDEESDGDWTSGSATPSVAIKGGISYEKWQGPNYFVTYLAANKPFLTWQLEKRCSPEEICYLYYLHSSAQLDAINLQAKIHYTDGTDNTAVYLDALVPLQYGIYSCPAGLKQLAIDEVTPAKMIQYYDISVINAGGTLAGPFRFYPDYRVFSSAKFGQFSYVNSLGGMDSVRILGQITPTMKYAFDSAEQSVDSGYYNLHDLVPQLIQLNVTEQRTYKANVGFLLPREQDLLRDANINRQISQPIGDRWIPVIITGTDQAMALNTDKLWTMDIEFQYAFANINFTPDDIEIGDLPACPIPLNLQVTNIDGSSISLSWEGSALANNYVIEAQGSGKPLPPHNSVIHIDWTTVGNTADTVFTFDAATWGTIQFRVKTYCAIGSSGYSNTTQLINL